MTIYTETESTVPSLYPSYAATAASFILEERTGRKPKLNCTAIKVMNPNRKLTIEQINALTQQVLLDTRN